MERKGWVGGGRVPFCLSPLHAPSLSFTQGLAAGAGRVEAYLVPASAAAWYGPALVASTCTVRLVKRG